MMIRKKIKEWRVKLDKCKSQYKNVGKWTK